MRTKNLSLLLFLLTVLPALFSCRKGPKVLPEGITEIPDENLSAKSSFYLLNEGNMNMNKASLDYFDNEKGIYRRNIFEYTNPEVTRGLGDVGNDIKIYGSKLYIVVNISNKVEVLNVSTGKRIAMINIPNCRYITFREKKAYVSSYQGRVGDPDSPAGYVAQIDTASLQIERTVSVGRQPEEMAIVGDSMYVANSGGYNPENYESTLSVIDLNTFRETRRIEVAINLHRVKADRYGDLYVTSRGDYYDIPSRLFVIDTQSGRVKKTFDIAASNLWIDEDRAYILGVQFSYPLQRNTISYALLNVKDETMISDSFISDGTEQDISKPYGIAVDPHTKDIYIGDAKDYVTPGTLYCFDRTGRKKWSVFTGDIPAHFAFVN